MYIPQRTSAVPAVSIPATLRLASERSKVPDEDVPVRSLETDYFISVYWGKPAAKRTAPP